MTDWSEFSADELEAIAARKRQNEAQMAGMPDVQRTVADAFERRFRNEYDEVYKLPTAPRNENSQIVISGYERNADGFIEYTGEARVWPDGRMVEEHFRIRDDGPDGCGGRRTTRLWRPGRCLGRVAPRG